MSVPSEESWSRAHGILFDYLGVDDLACVLAGTFARKMDAEGWPDLSPEQLDAWVDGEQHERLSDDDYDNWRIFATAIKRVRAGKSIEPDPLANLPEIDE